MKIAQGLGEASTEADISADTLEVRWEQSSGELGGVLLVDDEPHVLEALGNLLRMKGYQVFIAPNGQEGKQILRANEIGVLIADQRMPDMTGADLLAYARVHSPCTARILLTGHNDIETAMEAINRGGVFRLVEKPWETSKLLHILELAMGNYQLVSSQERLDEQLRLENEALKQNNQELELRVAEHLAKLQAQQMELSRLRASFSASSDAAVKALISIIELGDLKVAEHCRRTATLVQQFGVFLKLSPERILELERAAQLHWLGLLNAPTTLYEKECADFDAVEQATWEFHPLLGQQAICHMPALQRVGMIILHYLRPFAGPRFQNGDCCEEGDGVLDSELIKDCQILAICSEFSRSLTRREPGSARSWQAARERGLARLQNAAQGRFCPKMLGRFQEMIEQELFQSRSRSIPVDLEELLPGMILAGPVETTQGIPVVPGETVITSELLERLRRFQDNQGLKPIVIWN